MRAIVLPFVPAWVKPNMLTVLRFMLTPAVLLLIQTQHWDFALPLFLFTAFTDALDGSLARLRHQITAWGTFYDPVADKMLIGSISLLVVAKYVSPWFAFLMLGMEVMIVLGGAWGRRRGHIISSNIFGKCKMLFQVIGITLLIFAVWKNNLMLYPWAVGVLVVSLVLAAISFFTYGL